MTDSLRVLLAEDSPADAKLVIVALRKEWPSVKVERVETAKAMRAALAPDRWDLVISDWSMPNFSAPAALAILKETGLDLPFIIVSGTIGEEIAVEAMRAGAQDYVLKDKLARLVPAVERELREFKERAARRRAEDALRESEARFRRLAEAGIIGIVTINLAGKFYDVNEAYARLVGYSRDELTAEGRQWPDLMPPEWRATDAAARRELTRMGTAAPREMELIRKDGSRVPVLVGAAMLDSTLCIAFVLDLSSQKRAEQEKDRFGEEAKTAQLAQGRAEEALRQSEAQLRHAQKMEAVGRLAGGVAHDFNNVLSVILCYGEAMLGELAPADPMRAEVEEIRKAASRAAGLTRQLLLFSRQQVVGAKVLDLHEALAGMGKMLERLVGEDVDLILVKPKMTGRIRVDPTHVEQVVLNLVVNARDAMPGGGKLTIETHNVVLDEAYAMTHLPAKSGSYVMLAVTDTGMGMDRETQAKIFEPFFTTKEIGRGTGLGLSTVFGIVQQSNGNVWVYSEPGRGTTFKVYLPRVDDEVDGERHQSVPTSLRGTETILVVEDEEQVRAVIASLLRRNGYRVILAQHPGEALVLAEREPNPIHLLLTDVVMPLMSGPELARRLAATRPKTKLVCMSGYTDDSVVRHGVIDARIAFIQKPVTPSSLLNRVREVLDEPASLVLGQL
jgi:two-component system, cell cycle sensor histidine kinase and response regulator CckA